MSQIKQYSAYKSPFEGDFNISPSSLTTWMDNPAKWKRTHIDKEKFNGNTATVFGTIIHAGIEQHFDEETLTDSDVTDYLQYFKENAEVDEWYIMEFYKETIDVAIEALSKPDKQEYKTGFSPVEGYSIGGTADYRRGGVVGDYKSTAKKKNSIGEYYWQLMCLAYCDKQNGIDTDTIEVVYITKPSAGTISEKTGKRIGVKKAEVNVVSQPIGQEDFDRIEKFLKNMIKTLKLYDSDYGLEDVLFRENYTSFRK